jgi:hypothetical protein
MNRRILHVLLGLILLACVVSSFVEFAIHSNDSLFSAGYDTEPVVTWFVLLIELVSVLAGVVAVVLTVRPSKKPLFTCQCVDKRLARLSSLPPGCRPLVPLRL